MSEPTRQEATLAAAEGTVVAAQDTVDAAVRASTPPSLEEIHAVRTMGRTTRNILFGVAVVLFLFIMGVQAYFIGQTNQVLDNQEAGAKRSATLLAASTCYAENQNRFSIAIANLVEAVQIGEPNSEAEIRARAQLEEVRKNAERFPEQCDENQVDRSLFPEPLDTGSRPGED